MNRRIKLIAVCLLGAVVLALGLLAAGCGDDDNSGAASTSGGAAVDGTSVSIADKGFTESQIVAQLYAQALASVGYKPDVTSLGGTEIADPAVIKGDIDLYPEYTGTAYNILLKKPGAATADQAYATIKKEYPARGLVALTPAAYDNPNQVACTQEAVDKYGLKTLSDLGKASPNLVYSANPEHLTRPDGLPLLKSAYGVNFKDIKVVAINLRYKPIEDGQADCVYAFGTDRQVVTDNLVVLTDDKAKFASLPYQTFPVVNKAFYDAQPPVFAETLDKVSALLTAENARELNGQVDLDKEDPSDVAKAFLEKNGVVTQ
jgi:osmoprotectant transport system substrate-binding protein